MTSMISEEVEMIKRVHSQMPPQLQQIIRIEGDKVTLVESEFFYAIMMEDEAVVL